MEDEDDLERLLREFGLDEDSDCDPADDALPRLDDLDDGSLGYDD